MTTQQILDESRWLLRFFFVNDKPWRIAFHYALTLIATLTVVWYAFLEPPYLSYGFQPFPVLNSPHAGEAVLLHVSRCNSSLKTSTYLISHTLVNLDTGARVVLAPGIVSLEPGCTDEVSAANVTPRTTPPGRYIVTGFAEIQGRIRTTSIKWSSGPFTVLPKESKP